MRVFVAEYPNGLCEEAGPSKHNAPSSKAPCTSDYTSSCCGSARNRISMCIRWIARGMIKNFMHIHNKTSIEQIQTFSAED